MGNEVTKNATWVLYNNLLCSSSNAFSGNACVVMVLCYYSKINNIGVSK